MMFWALAALLTALVVGLLIRPLMRRGDDSADPAAAEALRVYTQQLGEVERDLARGLLSDREAADARAEIGRRALAAADERDLAARPTFRPSPRLALLLAGVLPLVALAAYLPLGRPSLPSRPFQAAEGEAAPKEVLEAVAKLAQHMKEQPDDLSGWRLLGQTYVRLGKYDDAVAAFREAHSRAPMDPDFASSLGEALSQAGGGTVSEEARLLFERAVAADENDARARFYLAMARYQVGDWKGAAERWAELVRRSPADASYLEQVGQRLTEAAQRAGIDVASLNAVPLPSSSGIDPGQMADVANLPPEQRQQAIRGMVEGLAAKLQANPGDIDGWLRLARARTVLGDRVAAGEAYRNALAAAPERTDVAVAYAEFLMPEGDGPSPPAAIGLLKGVLAREPGNVVALWHLGRDAASSGRNAEARTLWTKLLPLLSAGSAERAEVERRLAQLKS